MFVQSLSWQKDRFYIKMAQKDRFYSPQLLGAPLLQDRHTLFFERFPFVCPEPVLAKMMGFCSIKWHHKDARFLTCRIVRLVIHLLVAQLLRKRVYHTALR